MQFKKATKMSIEYAIVIERSRVRVMSDEDYSNEIDLDKGMFVEIQNTSDSSSIFCSIKIFDYYQINPAFLHNIYFCKRSTLLTVSVKLWPFLISIHDPLDRLNVARDKVFSEYIISLEVNSFVEILGDKFHQSEMRQSLDFSVDHSNNPDFNCIVRYIGKCTELGPGYFFGLELLVIFLLSFDCSK